MIGWHKTQILLLPWFPAKNKTPALTYSIQCKCPNWSQPTCSGKYYNNNNHKQILLDKVKTKNLQKKWMNLNFDFRKFFGFFDSSLIHHILTNPQHLLEFPSPLPSQGLLWPAPPNLYIPCISTVDSGNSELGFVTNFVY